MRYSRTALKELKRRYSLILKRCFVLNLMLGCFVLGVPSVVLATETGGGSTEGEVDPSNQDETVEDPVPEGSVPTDEETENKTDAAQNITERMAVVYKTNLTYVSPVVFKELTGNVDGAALSNRGNVTFNKTVSFTDNKGII